MRLSIIPTCLLLLLLSAAAYARPSPEPAVSLDDLRAFTDAWGYVRDRYVEDIDDRTLLEAAMRGMLDTLDPHSKWLSPEEFRELEQQATGRYGGIGIQIRVMRDHLRIVSVFEHGPADRAGLQVGDRIVSIDELDLDENTVADAPGMLRGPAGTQVRIHVSREGVPEGLAIVLTRELVERESVTIDHLAPRLHHIHIQRFQQTTASEFDRILDALEENDDDWPAGVILDLRNNPGGVLKVAIEVADRLLSDRLVVTARGRAPDDSTEYRTGPGQRLADVPLLVLVDRGTASASEILAAALRDHGRALIVGEITYGKGSVQTIWPLPNNSGIRLTTALYYTPSGQRIQARGIRPDVFSSATHVPEADFDPRRREADLTGHFPGEEHVADELQALAETDIMLADALRLLIAMSRMQKL